MAKQGKLRKIFDIYIFSLIIALIIFLLIGYLSEFTTFAPFKTAEAAIGDQYLRNKTIKEASAYQEGVVEVKASNPHVSDKILIIGIDTESLQELGRWPWPRSVQARVLQSTARISEQVNRELALLLDIFYTEPGDPEQDLILYESILENGRVFLENILDWDLASSLAERERIYAYQDFIETIYESVKYVNGNWQQLPYFLTDEPPLPLFASAMKGIGHAQYTADPDQVYRKARLIARFSRVVVEKMTSLDELGKTCQELKPDLSKYEWLAYCDINNNFHFIDPAVIENKILLDDLKKTIKEKGLVDIDENGQKGYRLRLFKDRFIPSIVLSLVLEYYHKKPSDAEVVLGQYIKIKNPEEYIIENGKGQWKPLTQKGQVVSEIKIPIDEHGMMQINYAGPSSENTKIFPVLPFSNYAIPETIPDPTSNPAEWPSTRGLSGKIVIVCAFSKGMALDEKMTPFGLMYGGEIHANAINTILMGSYIINPPSWVSLLILFFIIFLAAFISSRLPPLYSLFIMIWLIAVYYLAVNQLFDTANIALKFISPVTALILTFLAIVAYRVIFEEQDKRRIKSTFTKYVSASVVEQLLINPPELGGVDKEITVLFSDIRGYTSLSETMSPQALINHLNLYLTRMTDTLMAYEGTLDKYVGDMVMCFWGAPLPQKNHAILACKCALKMLEELAKLNEGWPPEKRIDIGIGINSGIMTVGNMGSPGRMNYTLIGDNVNLGSRLEGTNKEYGTHIIISEYTYGLVKDRVIARELDNIRVKGKNKPVLIYELIDVKDGLDPTVDLEE